MAFQSGFSVYLLVHMTCSQLLETTHAVRVSYWCLLQWTELSRWLCCSMGVSPLLRFENRGRMVAGVTCQLPLASHFLTIYRVHHKGWAQTKQSLLSLPFHTEKQKYHITPSTADMACHQRSTSLPSFPYSTELNVEQELQTLKVHISSPSATISTACDGLRRLGDVYSCIEEMMCLPSNQALTGQRKMVEEELEKSLVLIDLCNAMQESLAELKTSVQELRLVLKRRDNAAAQLKIESFVRLVKKLGT